MNELVFTIQRNDVIFQNDQYRVPLSKTNIPNDLGIFKGDFYWAAEIIDYDELSRTVRVKIVDYDVPSSRYVEWSLNCYQFERIDFESLDKNRIHNALGLSDKGFPTETESVVREAERKNLIPSNGLYFYRFEHNGTVKDLPLVGCHYDKFSSKFYTRFDFRHALGKDTVSIIISLKQGHLQASSPDLEKVLPTQNESVGYRTTGNGQIIIEAEKKDFGTRSGNLFYRFDHDETVQNIPLLGLTGVYYEQKTLDLFDFDRILSKKSVTVRIKNHQGYWEACSPELMDVFSAYENSAVYSSYTGIEWIKCSESIQVKINDLYFEEGFVTFWLNFPLKIEVKVENPIIKPEFKYIARYFSKAIGKQSVAVDIVLYKHQDWQGRVSALKIESSHSADIDKIDQYMIVEAEKKYCVDHLFSKSDKNTLQSIEDLLSNAITDSEKLSPSTLIDVIAEKRGDSKHALQLKYLAQQHRGDLQPLRFGKEQSVKSFLFLLMGKELLYFVLETIDEKLATYLWACPNSHQNLEDKTSEIESLVSSLEKGKRREYSGTDADGFYKIIHEYKNEEDDFLAWQQKLFQIMN